MGKNIVIDTNGVTLTASNIRSGKVAYISSGYLTGTITAGALLSPKTKPLICVCCGAPRENDRCEYCGTRYY